MSSAVTNDLQHPRGQRIGRASSLGASGFKRLLSIGICAAAGSIAFFLASFGTIMAMLTLRISLGTHPAFSQTQPLRGLVIAEVLIALAELASRVNWTCRVRSGCGVCPRAAQCLTPNPHVKLSPQSATLSPAVLKYHRIMPTHFSPQAITFLRGLARNNQRDWFEARRSIYEQAVKAPMLALVDEINAAMRDFAPRHLRPAHKVMMRIYRDTRFSKDKRPYKTHLAAWWSRAAMEKTSGAGFYLQISPQQVIVAAGVYMPDREQLLILRRWMSAHHLLYRTTLQRLLKTRGAGFAPIDPAALTRMPKGFLRDDPAGELVRANNWGVQACLPPELALSPQLGKQIVRRLRSSAPLVEMLNGAILQADAEPPMTALNTASMPPVGLPRTTPRRSFF
ncbi:MAG: DUF2461 domain-containing protein [Acidobacteriaceae bacterium]